MGVYVIVSFATGCVVGILIYKTLMIRGTKKKIAEMEEKGKEKSIKILQDANTKAERIKRNKLLEFKEKEVALRTDNKQHFENNKRKIAALEKRLKERENIIKDYYNKVIEKEKSVATWQEQIQDQKKRYYNLIKEQKEKDTDIENIKQDLLKEKKTLKANQQDYLKRMAEVKNIDLSDIENKFKIELKSKLQEEESNLLKKETQKLKDRVGAKIKNLQVNLEFESKKVLLTAIQKIPMDYVKTSTTTIFHLNSDEEKGKIIGREGKHIRALENSTGASFIIDDTPATVIISSFDPYRREIAKLTLERLTQTKIINVAFINSTVEEIKSNMEQHILQLGEEVLKELNIKNMDSNLIRMVAKMGFYLNGNYNLLKHSKEVATLAGNLASELNLNPNIVKRAALLHDIGKVYDDKTNKPHDVLSMELAQKYGENGLVCLIIANHHKSNPANLMSAVIQIANEIVNKHMGYSKDIVKNVFKRSRSLENIPLSFEGVTESYVLDSGKELYIIVDANIISDDKSYELSEQIVKKVEQATDQPENIKITLVRKKEIVTYSS